MKNKSEMCRSKTKSRRVYIISIYRYNIDSVAMAISIIIDIFHYSRVVKKNYSFVERIRLSLRIVIH